MNDASEDNVLPVNRPAKPTPKKSKKTTSKKKAKVAKTKLDRNKPVKPTGVRTERLDMRLTKAEKSKISALAKKQRRTITSVIAEAIENTR